MKKALLKCFSFMTAFMFVFLIYATPAAAARISSVYALDTVRNKNVSYYEAKTIIIGTKKLSEEALLINGEIYAPVRKFVNTVYPGATVTYNSQSRTITVKSDALTLTATDGTYVVYANDRPLFAKTPIVILSNGRMYIPLDTLTKALGVRTSESGSTVTVSGKVSPLLSAGKFYREDEIYWLSRIISAESRGEPLIGQIAVGNVVLNRTRSKDFPNTIWGVIFDRKYGVQFEPIINGSIHQAPAYTSVLAAKICLEGFSVSEDVLYFLEPRISTSGWIQKTRPYAFTIGNHDFYR